MAAAGDGSHAEGRLYAAGFTLNMGGWGIFKALAGKGSRVQVDFRARLQQLRDNVDV